MLSTAILVFAKRVSGERHGNNSYTNTVKLCRARLEENADGTPLSDT